MWKVTVCKLGGFNVFRRVVNGSWKLVWVIEDFHEVLHITRGNMITV